MTLNNRGSRFIRPSCLRLSSVVGLGLLATACGPAENNDNNTTATNNTANNTAGGTTGTNNTTGAEEHDTGKRCEMEEECRGDIAVCFSEFFGERPVCTQECGAAAPCPGEMECVGGISDDNGVTLGPRCVRPCETNADCEPFGSECDSDESTQGASYCF